MLKVQQDQQVMWVLTVLRVLQVLKVHKVLQDRQAQLVLQVPVVAEDFLVSAVEKFHWDPAMTV